MTRRGKRGLEAEQVRYLNRLISREAWKDLSKAEAINIYTVRVLEQLIRKQFGVVVTPAFLKHSQGEVISDPRGEGSFQRYKIDKHTWWNP